jgi:hypothetical protein
MDKLAYYKKIVNYECKKFYNIGPRTVGKLPRHNVNESQNNYVFLPNFILQSVILLNVILANVIVPKVTLPNVTLPNFIMPNVILPNAIRSNAILPNVVAPGMRLSSSCTLILLPAGGCSGAAGCRPPR